VDLDRFTFSEVERKRRRAELNLADQFTLVYSGSIDGWYLTERMVEFFAALLKINPDAHFLWLTPGKHDRIRSLMARFQIKSDRYSIRFVSASEVPNYLSAADAGIAFIKPCFSKLASSPTKNAEYLACGLPLVINAGIGDSDALVTEHHSGALLRDFTEAEYVAAKAVIERLVTNADETRRRAREIAERLFNLKTVGATRYARLYERVLSGE
jgi:glycosyltransferase involved in cell wall biosynthesis